MQVRQVDKRDRRQVARFVRLPFSLYRGNPYWVPPLISDAATLFDEDKHPFYQHSEADFFLVEKDRQALGRIAVINNKRYNQHLGLNQAFFGYFESVDDTQVSGLLFERAFQWARQHGRTEIYGPTELLGADASGVLVEGFDQYPAMGVPYNHAYYDGLVKAAGFEKDVDALGGCYSAPHPFPKRLERIAERVKARGKLRIKTFSAGENLKPWVPHVVRIYRQAFEGNYTFYPPTDAEMAWMGDQLLSIIDPQLVKLVMSGDEAVGFVLAYPNTAIGLQRANGHLWPIGWYHILRDRRRTRRLDVNGVGLLPEYQGVGGNALLYSELGKTIHTFGYEHIDVVHVGEENLQSRGDQEALGARWYKRHRSYRRTL